MDTKKSAIYRVYFCIINYEDNPLELVQKLRVTGGNL